MGLVGLDLVEPADWPVLHRHGLICTMTPSHPLVRGLNHPANHAECIAKITAALEATAAAGFPNVICFPGNRDGEPAFVSDDDGARHTLTALQKVAPMAERLGVTLHLELLNSKVDHPGYMGDRTEWLAAILRKLGSPRVKMLYDIYHMQVQEGDVIATIRKHHELIGHYHTAGVPGRHELDDRQELNYPAIVRAIRETGYDGFFVHEFVPTGEPMAALRAAVKLCGTA